jgi:hypothetical protein
MMTKEDTKSKNLTPREKQFSPLPEEVEPNKARLIMQQAAYKALGEIKQKPKR